MTCPQTPEQLAEALRDFAASNRTMLLGGAFSKNGLGGPAAPADETVSTCAMRRLIQYEPRDLTISVEAGMRFAELERILAANRQMIPLDPGWEDSTVGGVIAANLSGPRRRLYGTARDMIIGMTFATLDGKLIRSGGMVVKNVAGLDMAKLMIGSFGTLAAIATVNFKLFPITGRRSFEMNFDTAAPAFAERDRILRGVLQPAAIDIVNWPDGFRLLIEAAGNTAVLDRFERELPGARVVDETAWREVLEFTPRFLQANPGGAVVPRMMKLTEMATAMEQLRVPAIARAGSGVIYAHYSENPPAPAWNGDFATMERIKEMFDRRRLLNRGRLYGRI
ncbi:MAG TPA: FAD-binding protein [Bryobacteraceae bacterium]|nr:FAD-binding protein [Bryobacteraceae bacterium]